MAKADNVAKKPKKRRWYHTFAEAYRMVTSVEPWVTWAIIGSLLASTVIGVGIGIVLKHPIYLGFLGFLIGTVIAMSILATRTRKVSFKQIENQPGAAIAILSQIKRGWAIEQSPVQVSRNQDLVFRLIGRAGVVLVAEKRSGQMDKLIADEKRRVSRVVPDHVPIHVIMAGKGKGEVPLSKLERVVRSLPKAISNGEVAAVSRRLHSLGALNLPIPKGIDPMRVRPDHRGLRGK